LERVPQDWTYFFDRIFCGLAFAGGGVASVCFFAPLLWSRRTWVAWGGILFALTLGALVLKGSLFKLLLTLDGHVRWLVVLQATFYIMAGLHLLALACGELYQRRDAVSALLFCWIVGTFAFVMFFNWTINGRTLLPMVPAIAILVARRLEHHPAASQAGAAVYLPLVPALCLALAVTWADYALANTQRQAAATITRKLQTDDKTIWFQGHWGFQYYMEQSGAKAVDIDHPTQRPGDFLVVPKGNTNLYAVDRSYTLLDIYRLSSSRGLGTMHRPPLGAGFYAAQWGPLPFAFGRVPDEEYWLYRKL
jgi:hypothetical protein